MLGAIAATACTRDLRSVGAAGSKLCGSFNDTAMATPNRRNNCHDTVSPEETLLLAQLPDIVTHFDL
jgi:hypothetical protein